MGPYAAALTLLLGATLACADPTAIDVTVYSEVPCSDQAEVALSVAADPQSLASTVPGAVATRCDDLGDGTARRGHVVIVPRGDRGKQVAFQLTTRNDAQSLDACRSDPKGCIAARRQLRFQPNKTIQVRIDLRLSCLGVACPVDQTCVAGACVPSLLAPCDTCGEPDAGARVPDPPSAVTAVPVPTGVVTTLAGSGVNGYADGTGAAASFAFPSHVAVDGAGNVYVADYGTQRIRRVTNAGVVTTLAGSGAAAYADGAGSVASFNNPAGVAVDGALNVYVGDYNNNRIRKVTSAGVVTTLAGSGTAGYADGTGAAASFQFPLGVAVDGAGNVYVADFAGCRIRAITSAGVVTTLAGSGTNAYADGTGIGASFSAPAAVAVDGAGNVFVAEGSNRIRAVTSAGVVTTFAGSGADGSADGTGTASSFSDPRGLAIDGMGGLYIADTGNHRIRKVTNTGVVTTLAGSSMGYTDGIGAAASFDLPTGVAADAAGNVYVADSQNNRIRKVSMAGSGQLVVAWVASTATVPAVASYVASASASGHSTQTCTTTGSTGCIIVGLTSGVAYSVTVTATSALGPSAPSAPIVATPN